MKYRIPGHNDVVPKELYDQIRSALINLLRGKTIELNVPRVQMMMWIQFRKDRDPVKKTFDSWMTNIYQVSDLDSIVDDMQAHMLTQIENPTLDCSRFIINRVLQMNVTINCHHLAPRGSYIPVGLN